MPDHPRVWFGPIPYLDKLLVDLVLFDIPVGHSWWSLLPSTGLPTDAQPPFMTTIHPLWGLVVDESKTARTRHLTAPSRSDSGLKQYLFSGAGLNRAD